MTIPPDTEFVNAQCVTYGNEEKTDKYQQWQQVLILS